MLVGVGVSVGVLVGVGVIVGVLVDVGTGVGRGQKYQAPRLANARSKTGTRATITPLTKSGIPAGGAGAEGGSWGEGSRDGAGGPSRMSRL